MKQTILIADDEKHIRDMVKEYLSGEGFRVVTANSGRNALFVARQENPDLILLDIMMPELNGFDFVRVYGHESHTPIIMLTAKLEANDKVLGLELGADDYITKPFNMRELTARIRAVLRRLQKPGQENDLLRANGIVVDVAGKRVFVDDRVVDLTRTEFHILSTLMAQPGRVFARLDLIDASQGPIYAGYERSIDTHIRRLRQKIETDPKNPMHIETVYGFGYRFVRHHEGL